MQHRRLATGVLALALLLAAAGPAAARQRYTVVQLGTLGGPSSSALAVNDHGQVTGYADLGSLNDGQRNSHAFLWTAGSMVDLGASNPVRDDSFFCSCSSGAAVNESGDVAGASELGDDPHAAFWPAGGALQLVNVGLAHGINDAGVVVGELGDDLFRLPFVAHGTSWQLIDIPSLLYGSAADVNDAGEVVGIAHVMTPAGGLETHPFIADGSGIRLLPFTGSAEAVSESGTIAGDITLHSGHSHAYVAGTDGVPHDLGTLGARDSHAAAVNDAGEVVGWSRTAGHDQHAFVVLPGDGSMRDLNRLIPRRLGLVLVQASGVNDRGEIAATALPAAGGPSRAVLLVPR